MRDHRTILPCLCLLLITGFIADAWCQEKKPANRPAPPAGILLNPPPDFSQWVVTFSYPQDRPERTDSKRQPFNGDPARKVTVTKTKNILHEETVSVAGAKFEKWQNSSRYYIKPQGQSYWGECDAAFLKNNPTPDPKFLPLPTDKFRDLEWVGNQTYAGSLKDQGREYLLFVPADSTNLDVTDSAKLKTIPVIVYIDAATRLPVVFKNREIIQQYTFVNAPTEMQVFPPDLTQEIKDGDERHSKAFALPRNEY